MTIVDVYGARKTAKVMDETWGHLRPEPSRTYEGTILFAHTDYGELVALSVAFDAPDSPWFFEAMNDFVCESAAERAAGIYRFTGTYRVESGFVGTTQEVPV